MAGNICQDDLLGAWSLCEWLISYSDGRAPARPFGDAPAGLLIYAPGGFMSAGIARDGRSGFAGGNVRLAAESSRAAAFDSYFQYQGRFRVTGSVVEHHVLQSLNPDFVGTVQRREAVLDGKRLALSAEDSLPGGIRRTHRLIWERA